MYITQNSLRFILLISKQTTFVRNLSYKARLSSCRIVDSLWSRDAVWSASVQVVVWRHQTITPTIIDLSMRKESIAYDFNEHVLDTNHKQLIEHSMG